MRLLFTIAFFLVAELSIDAQISNNAEYRIDASQRQSPSQPGQSLQQVSSFALNQNENLIIAVNRQLYKSTLLTNLMPYIQNNKYKVSLEILSTAEDLAKYTQDKSVEKLLLIKMPRRLACKLRKQNQDFRIN